MFRDPMVENDLLLGRTDAVVRETQVEEALSAYQSQHLALRFVGDRGIEYLPEDPFQAEVQIKSLLGKGYIPVPLQDANSGECRM